MAQYAPVQSCFKKMVDYGGLLYGKVAKLAIKPVRETLLLRRLFAVPRLSPTL